MKQPHATTVPYSEIPARSKPDYIHGDTVRLPTGTYTYQIRLEQLDTPCKLLQWVEHLGRKPWVDARMLAELVEQVTRYHGWQGRQAAT